MVANPSVQNNGQVQGTQGGANGDSLGRMTSGPAALAQLLIYQIMALYAEIIELDQQQKAKSLQAQLKEAEGQAKASVSGGEAIGNALIQQGWLTFAGALVSAGVTVGGSMIGTRGLKNEQSELEAQMKPLEKIKEFSNTAEAEAVEAGALNEIPQDQVTTLAQKLKNGDYSDLLDEKNQLKPEVQSAISRLKRLGSRGVDAEGFEGFDFEEFGSNNRQDLNRLATKHNSLSSALSNQSQQYQIFSQASSGILNGIGSTRQGDGQAEKGLKDADASLNATAAQQAGSTANDFGQGMNKAYEAQNGEVQILEKLHQSNSARG